MNLTPYYHIVLLVLFYVFRSFFPRISTYLKIPSKTILEIQQQRRATNIGSGALLACFSEMVWMELNDLID